MCCILPRVCPNFPWYYISDLWRACPVNGSTAINYFSYVESVLKCVSTFLNFPVGNHSFTSSMMWSVWSTMKPRVNWKIRKFNYIKNDTSWNCIPKCSSKTLVNSVNDVSLVVVLITSSVETVRKDTVSSEKLLCR